MVKRKEIRNSTAEFLIFQIEGKEQGVEVYYKDKTVWCTQKVMGMLFDCSTDNIGLHLKKIYDSGELEEKATTEKISVVRQEGSREVNRTLQFYNLDAVISVGYRVNSIRATRFRQWATSVLREFAIRGYVLDKKRMENGSFLGESDQAIAVTKQPAEECIGNQIDNIIIMPSHSSAIFTIYVNKFRSKRSGLDGFSMPEGHRRTCGHLFPYVGTSHFKKIWV